MKTIGAIILLSPAVIIAFATNSHGDNKNSRGFQNNSNLKPPSSSNSGSGGSVLKIGRAGRIASVRQPNKQNLLKTDPSSILDDTSSSSSSKMAMSIDSTPSEQQQQQQQHGGPSKEQLQEKTGSSSSMTRPILINRSSNGWLTPRTLSIGCMSLAMASQFFGYEFSRSASMTLFTSKESGFPSKAAFPLAMACVSPMSVLLLTGYGKLLQGTGPRSALKYTTLFCAALLSLSGFAIHNLGGLSPSQPIIFGISSLTPSMISKAIVGAVFVFQNCYATLLYSQHFSFMGSVATEQEGASWFPKIAGLSSICSTVAAALVPLVVSRVRLTGLYGFAATSLFVSMIFGDAAYSLSEKHGFDPSEEKKHHHDSTETKSTNKNTNIFWRASDIFRRVPVLGALFCEVLSFQSVVAILNLCFVTALKENVPNDALRAAWTGKYYALINGTCGILQFAILPFFFQKVHLRWVWRIMPLMLATMTLVQAFQTMPTLFLVSMSFCAIKVMEYSVRATANEMVFVPLDFESRYVGKEVIGVFGNLFGKSGMALALAGLTSQFGTFFGVQSLSCLASMATVGWLGCTVRLSNRLQKQSSDDYDDDDGKKKT